jgi:hypothetical protein
MPDSIVKEAMEALELASEAENENRKRALDDIKFARIPGNQWPKKVRQQRQKDGLPCFEIDVLGPVIRQVVNDSRMNRPSTTIMAVDSKADPETANVLSGLVRNIESYSNADIAYDTAVESTASGGFGYWRIAVDYQNNALDEDGIMELGASAFDKSIFLRAIPNPFSVYGDPFSTGADSSDWMQAHVVEKMAKARFKQQFKGADEVDFSGVAWSGISEPWFDGENVQVAEYWKRERVEKKALAIQTADDVLVVMADQFEREKDRYGQAEVVGERPVLTYKVTQYLMNGVEVLETTDWKGSYIPLIPVYGEEVNVEGKRHLFSMVSRAKDSQQNFNYWRSSSTALVALAPKVPFVVEEGTLIDPEKWSTANNMSHAYLEVKKGTQNIPKRQESPPIPQGMMQEALSAADDVKRITGIYDASLGARSNETSGVAIRARQQEGDVSTFHFIDNLARSIRHSGRVVVDLIPGVMTGPRIERILQKDGSAQQVPINQPTVVDGVERLYDVRTGQYDVVVSTGPSFTTRRAEAAQQMMDLIQSYPDAAPVIGDLLVKSLDWENADEIAKRLKAMLPPQIQGQEGQEGQIPPEVMQQMQQMSEALGNMQQELKAAQNDNALKSRELDIKAFEAETDRIEALHKMQQPTELPQEEPPSQRQAA